MEYLFLGDHPGLPSMMDNVVEAGLMPAAEAAAKVGYLHGLLEVIHLYICKLFLVNEQRACSHTITLI